MLYASCLHFVEEQDPMNVLALISSADRYGSKTTDLPPWISLRGIQQDSTQTRYFLPKCICLISSVPLFKTFQKFLVHLYRVMHTDDNPMCETPEASAFRFLQQIHIPPDTYSQVAFKVGDQACLISGLAPNSPLFYPNEVEFHLALQHLSPENIVKVEPFTETNCNHTLLMLVLEYAGVQLLADRKESGTLCKEQGCSYTCSRNLSCFTTSI